MTRNLYWAIRKRELMKYLKDLEDALAREEPVATLERPVDDWRTLEAEWKLGDGGQ